MSTGGENEGDGTTKPRDLSPPLKFTWGIALVICWGIALFSYPHVDHVNFIYMGDRKEIVSGRRKTAQGEFPAAGRAS